MGASGIGSSRPRWRSHYDYRNDLRVEATGDPSAPKRCGSASAAAFEQGRRHGRTRSEPSIDPIDRAFDIAPPFAAQQRELLLPRRHQPVAATPRSRTRRRAPGRAANSSPTTSYRSAATSVASGSVRERVRVVKFASRVFR